MHYQTHPTLLLTNITCSRCRRLLSVEESGMEITDKTYLASDDIDDVYEI